VNFRNHCVKCDAVIPRRKKAYYGNAYRPVVCSECSRKANLAIYGSLKAIREEGLL
jgi:hypothetical protein